MALREIIILPDKQLRLVSKPVEKVTAEIRKLADDMFETMYDAPGIGLAAIQVAQPLRLIMSSASLRISVVTFSTGLETSRSCLSGRMMISLRAIARDLSC